MDKGKVAFISGANRGIGFETARELAEKGVIVIIGSRDKAKGDEAAEKIASKGLKARAFQCDVTNLADHKKLYDYIEKNFGKLDILINNAGVWLDSSPGDGTNRTSTTSQDILRKTFDANFFSLVALTQTLLPLIKKSPEGRIVNLSSILGSLTLQADEKSPSYGFKAFAYDASKAAVNAFTIHLAAELKNTNIKVNSAHPGWVKTDMGSSAAPMEPADGAKTSAELALIGTDGPTGGFYHLGKKIPW
jgi:NAD(P)-dependent dehydrogenase (short-subunit alcohol dehydrogenase family)